MGNLPSNKLCCCQQAIIEHELQNDFKPKHAPSPLHIEPIQPKPNPQAVQYPQMIKQQKEPEQNLKDNNENTQLQIYSPAIKTIEPKYFEIYLTPDQSWYRGMENNSQFPINIDEAYKELSNIKSQDQMWSKKVVRRSGYDNKKIQLLFKQHVPTIGKYFFQVDLISYIPSKKCDFTIGIVNYDFAKDKIHSRDSSHEQSHTFIERNLNIDEKHLSIPVELNLKIKVEVTREQEPEIAFYINGKLQKRQSLIKPLQKEAILLVPYIQTQYQGIVFGWKASLKRSISAYRISTIFEEPSSIISA